MKHKKSVVNRLIHLMELEPDIMPGLPIIELFENQRLIIENHLLVADYTTEQICVSLSYGDLHIAGKNLQIARLTKDKLVITGSIYQLTLGNGRG